MSKYLYDLCDIIILYENDIDKWREMLYNFTMEWWRVKSQLKKLRFETDIVDVLSETYMIIDEFIINKWYLWKHCNQIKSYIYKMIFYKFRHETKRWYFIDYPLSHKRAGSKDHYNMSMWNWLWILYKDNLDPKPIDPNISYNNNDIDGINNEYEYKNILSILWSKINKNEMDIIIKRINWYKFKEIWIEMWMTTKQVTNIYYNIKWKIKFYLNQ